MAQIYASDLAEERRTNAFMGDGFEEALAKAEANGKELIVGEFYPDDEWEEY